MRRRKLRYSFCRRSEDEVERMAGGARSPFGMRVCICGACAETAYRVTRGGAPPSAPARQTRLQRAFAWWASMWALLAAPACSTQQGYETGLGYERARCERVMDTAERDRCVEAARRAYPDYARERQGTLGRRQ